MTMMDRPEVRLFLLVNGCMALISGAVTLVLLLIAPLGLATVLTCTLLVTLICFATGIVGDLLLWHWLLPPESTTAMEGVERRRRLARGRALPLVGREAGRLMDRQDP